MSLEGRKIVVTGVLTRASIAFAVARVAQLQGAEVVLTSFGRARRMTERAARGLEGAPPILELDVNSDTDLAALAPTLSERWDHVDGVLHAIANAPQDALGGNFLHTPRASAESAFATSAYSLKALAVALLPLLCEAPHGAAIVGLDFDASVAWPVYDWMGVAKAALESVSRYLARDLGRYHIRTNLVSAGPIDTAASSAFDHFRTLGRAWHERAPLGWDMQDVDAIAETVCFLLSNQARAITGEIVHVDGGFHAVGPSSEEMTRSLAQADERPAAGITV
ncbi:MAG TPA: enoyl-ACP reductase FabI [Solirubrobacteraceae bacterium]